MQRVRAWICTTAAAVCVLTVVLRPGVAWADFRAGDVGTSIQTQSGSVWIYGDSWHPGGMFIRNAVTLNGRYIGTIRGVPKENWVWMGTPYLLPDGRVAVHGSEMSKKDGGGGMWDFKRVGQVFVKFDPRNIKAAEVTRIDDTRSPWSSSAAQDQDGPLVYRIDGDHHPHVGRPLDEQGNVQEIAELNAQISGQFSIVPDPWGGWWLVGTGPMLSRKVVAYPLESPSGPVIGSKIELMTLPKPTVGKYNVYAPSVHMELGGLLTWALNGSGGEEKYGLRRIENFWPNQLAKVLGKELPSSQPDPDPVTEPTPSPQPDPDPVTEPTPSPQPEPDPVTEPTPSPQPDPVTEPTPSPQPDPDPPAEPAPETKPSTPEITVIIPNPSRLLRLGGPGFCSGFYRILFNNKNCPVIGQASSKQKPLNSARRKPAAKHRAHSKNKRAHHHHHRKKIKHKRRSLARK